MIRCTYPRPYHRISTYLWMHLYSSHPFAPHLLVIYRHARHIHSAFEMISSQFIAYQLFGCWWICYLGVYVCTLGVEVGCRQAASLIG
jgi:hypothetical protein